VGRNRSNNKQHESPLWLLQRVPDGYWNQAKNRRLYMRWLGKQCGYRKPEDWYRLKKNHFYEHSGGGLLERHYRGSPLAALQELKPTYDWKPWLFHFTPQGYWKVKKNRMKYMDWLGEQLGYQKAEDWYQLTKQQFYDNHGGGFLANYYNDSPLAALQDYKPRRRWKAWLLKSVPQGYWHKPANRIEFLKWIGSRYHFLKRTDWYKLTRAHFLNNGGAGLLLAYYHDAPIAAVQELFPKYNWKREKFATR